MARKRPAPHIYDDVRVTIDRVTRFAVASREEQIAVLAELRSRSADDSATITMGFSSLVIAIFVVIAAPLLTLDLDPVMRISWIAALLIVLGLGIVLLVLMAPSVVLAAKNQARKECATV